jgi:mutator protein MutT
MKKQHLEIKGAFGIIIKGDSILLDLRTSENARVWEIPGGRVETGESMEDTVKRELKEEIDVTVRKTKLIGLINYGVYTLKTEVVSFFLIEDFSGNPRVADEEEQLIKNVKWVKINELPSILNLSWIVIDAIYFLSLKYKKYRKVYRKIESLYDNRQKYSCKYFFYSSKVSKLQYKGKIKSKTIPAEEEKLIFDLIKDIQSPVLEIGAGEGVITEILLKKLDQIDILEVNPTFRYGLKNNFAEKISFIEGVTEEFRSNNKYNAILIFETFLQVKSFVKFLFNISKFLNKKGKLVILLDNGKSDLMVFTDKVRKAFPIDKPEPCNIPSLQSIKEILLDFDFEIEEIRKLTGNLYLPSGLGDIKLPFRSNSKNSHLFAIIANKNS